MFSADSKLDLNEKSENRLVRQLYVYLCESYLEVGCSYLEVEQRMDQTSCHDAQGRLKKVKQDN